MGPRRPGLPPVRKSLGQHFLNDRRILGRIVDAIEPIGERPVLEIGPGRGALTELLLERASQVIAIEYDRMLAEHLRRTHAGTGKLRVIEADVLEVELGTLTSDPYLLVGNVPYYITTPILFQALRPPRPECAVFLVQKEVADRMAARAGDRNYGALSANLQALVRVESLFRVPAGAFVPPPRVDSALVRLTPLERTVIDRGEEQSFRELVQAIFGFRRKQMRRIVRALRSMSAEDADVVLEASAIAPESRPETLPPESFARLLRAMPKG